MATILCPGPERPERSWSRCQISKFATAWGHFNANPGPDIQTESVPQSNMFGLHSSPWLPHCSKTRITRIDAPAFPWGNPLRVKEPLLTGYHQLLSLKLGNKSLLNWG